MKQAIEDMVVEWKGREYYINILGFWKQNDRKKALLRHPSEMPRGLGKAWRLAKREQS